MTTVFDSAFDQERSRLFGLAYRMLGSATDAEDTVQDAYLRWHTADRDEIRHPSAWLTTTVTRLCLNRLDSAWARRVTGEDGLPDPVLTADGTLGPLGTAELRESVSFALLTLMRRLAPVERAVFVLREAFEYEYTRIGELLELTAANARQIYSRARHALTAGENRFPVTDSAHLADRFLTAARSGDLAALEELLTDDVRTWMDAGPRQRRRTKGRGNVPVAALAEFAATARYQAAEVNGSPAMLFLRDGRLVGVTVLDVADGRVTALRTVADPGKLAFAQRQLDTVTSSRTGS